VIADALWRDLNTSLSSTSLDKLMGLLMFLPKLVVPNSLTPIAPEHVLEALAFDASNATRHRLFSC
jgi:hypothetical protein